MTAETLEWQQTEVLTALAETTALAAATISPAVSAVAATVSAAALALAATESVATTFAVTLATEA